MSKRVKSDPGALGLRAVLSDELIHPQKLKAVIIGSISCKKNITSVISILSRILPMDEKFKFLKRVGTHLGDKPVVIISCSMTFDEAEDALVSSKNELLSAGLEFPLRQYEMICDPPATRAQFEVTRALWPCHFHEDKNLESLLSKSRPDIWGQDNFLRRMDYIKSAISLAFDKSSCSAAVVVDPQSGEIKARSQDSRHIHPLRHAVMNVIDTVAHSQGGGAWPDVVGEFHEDSNTKGYLLTGYEVYLSREPCCMCTMALLHSRTSRIFYYRKCGSSTGALESRVKLHTVPGLNHYFEVFVVEDNCSESRKVQ